MENEMNWMDYDVYLGDNCKIYNGDCLEVMKLIPAKSIDMILCDLPYGTTQNKWDTIIPFDKLWEQYERLIKPNGAIVLFSAQPFTTFLINSNIKMYKYNWVWSKGSKSGHLNAKKQPLRETEDIVVFYKNQSTYNPIFRKLDSKNIRYTDNIYKKKKPNTYGKVKEEIRFCEGREIPREIGYPTNILNFTAIGNFGSKKIHPTQKPVELMEYLIKTYTNEGETVLDNCIGSGTTAVACMNTNRECIGIEKDKKYYDLCTQRLHKIWSDKLNKQVNELF